MGNEAVCAACTHWEKLDRAAATLLNMIENQAKARFALNR